MWAQLQFKHLDLVTRLVSSTELYRTEQCHSLTTTFDSTVWGFKHLHSDLTAATMITSRWYYTNNRFNTHAHCFKCQFPDLAWYTIFNPTSFELVYPVGTNVFIAILAYNVVLKHPQWLMFWNSSAQWTYDPFDDDDLFYMAVKIWIIIIWHHLYVPHVLTTFLNY